MSTFIASALGPSGLEAPLVGRAADLSAAFGALERVLAQLAAKSPAATGLRPHLAHFRHRLQLVLASGDLQVEVRASSFLLEGREVYRQRRAGPPLCSALHADGVRGVTVDRRAEWTDILGLVEVIVLQVHGPAPREEDASTRLRALGGQRIRFELCLPDRARSVHRGSPPGGAPPAFPARWDPVPPLGSRAPVAWKPVSNQAYAEALAATGSSAAAADAVGLVDALVERALAHGSVSVGTVLAVAERLRQAMVQRGESLALVALLESMRRLHPLDPRTVQAAMRPFSGVALVLALVDHEVAVGSCDPRVVEARVSSLPGDPLPAYLQGLEQPSLGSRRRLLVELLARLARTRRQELEVAFEGASAEVASDLLRAMAIALPGRRVALAWMALYRPEPEVLEVACVVLGRAQAGPEQLDALIGLLGMPFPEIRLRALALLEGIGGDEAFAAVRQHLERAEGEAISMVEAAALGRSLVRLEPTQALPLLRSWVRPRRRWSWLGPGEVDRVLGAAAVSGLHLLDPAGSRAELERIAARAEASLADHCRRLLGEHAGEAS